MGLSTRSTKQKIAVESVLQKLGKFKSAQEIHELLSKSNEKVGLATVYRTLQSLSESGFVDVVLGADGENLYRACSPEHHHHLLCRKCGQTNEFSAPEIEKIAERISKKYNFSQTDHVIEISGICKECL
jgi:Fur family transcriptional regulator, ferric uptake regulator